jgi:sugar lactone lactonase YvrE
MTSKNMSLKRRTAAPVLLALAVLPCSAWAHPPDTPAAVALIASFNAAQLETPESLVFDHAGNLYISLALTGEIRRIAPDDSQSTFAVIPIGPPLTPCFSFLAIMGGVTVDSHDNLYVSAAACDLANRGIWKVSPNGQTQILATLPGEALPNGIAFYHDRLYVPDSFLGRVWVIPAEGGEATVWFDDPALLAPPPGSPFPGANGLKIFRDEVYVSNSGAGTIVVIPIEHGDQPGEPRIHANIPDGQGCDDFSFDVIGNLYCTTDPFRTLLRVAPNGSVTTLLTFADGLDGPTATAFGIHDEQFDLYITNGAFPFFSDTHRPSLMRLHLDVPGAPLNH